ncbi:MAG: hypothetical protein D6797_03085, partial [Bdellovibrio sp.]
AIPMFKNKTIEPGIERFFTNQLIKEFARSKVATISSKALAPVVLEGTVEKLEFKHGGQISGSPDDTSNNLPTGAVLTTEYRIYVTVRLKLIRQSDKKVLWQSDFLGERVYAAPQIGLPVVNSANPLYNHSARHENIKLIAIDLMADAHDRLTENF